MAWSPEDWPWVFEKDPLGVAIGWIGEVRELCDDWQLVRFQEECWRREAYDRIRTDLESDWSELEYFQKKLKHAAGVLETMLEDESAPFVLSEKDRKELFQ